MKGVKAGPSPAEFTPKTADEVRSEFREAGVSISGWAKTNGFDRAIVHNLLAGRLRGTYGQAHRIAVALGMKAGRIVDTAAFKRPQREVA